MKDPSLWVGKSRYGNKYNKKKHKKQRVERGFSDYDWWGFNSYLSWIIIGGLEKFKADSQGYPADLTPETWNDLLDKMIAGFKASEKLRETYDNAKIEELEPVRDEGLALFIERFDTLWD